MKREKNGEYEKGTRERMNSSRIGIQLVESETFQRVEEGRKSIENGSI